MADKKVLEFLQKAEQDPDLAARVRAIPVENKQTAFAELAKVAHSAGYSVTEEALETGIRECAPRELTEDDLEAVSAGTLTAFPCNTLKFSSPTFTSFVTLTSFKFP